MSDTTSKRHFFRTATALSTLAALISLSACSQSAPSASTSSTSEATPEATASATSAVPAVAGYKPGEIPPVPLFKVPPIGVFASNADKAVIDATSKISSVPGVTVAPAVCDGSGLVTNGGNTVLGGDGSGVSSNGDKQVVNGGDGSGVINEGPVSIVVDGTGGGVYNGPNLNIINNGDGTAMVNGQQVKADKAPIVGKVGKFPKVDSLKPVESCGTTITLEDGVLFDFGKSDIRPEAAATLKKLAEVLTNAKVPAAHVYGHTDSIGDDASNQTLSEERATAVVNELKKDGVTTTLDSQGFGESKPVAPNTNSDGSDNPAGRQANRRVEIFIPAF